MVLLTGSNGFLGKILMKELGHSLNLQGMSRKSGCYKVSLDREMPKFNQPFELVIHAAGKAHSVPKTEIEKKLFFDVNVTGTKNLLKGLMQSGVPKQFVFISSVSVYGQEFGKGINEEQHLEAKDAYGLSKIEAEELIIEWCLRHDVVCTILRLPLLVGENPPGNLGAMVKSVKKGYYFNIGGGKAKKSMVLAEDVATFIPKVAKIGGIYNLTDGVHPDFYELSEAISSGKRQLNLPVFIAKMAGFVGDLLGEKAPINSLKLRKITSDLTFDDTKARVNAGWQSRAVLQWYSDKTI